jgi:hypothetical protein
MASPFAAILIAEEAASVRDSDTKRAADLGVDPGDCVSPLLKKIQDRINDGQRLLACLKDAQDLGNMVQFCLS